ncbi:MAG: FAD binding domain-containing protein [Planctomycetes bacterium]|nr:FAD binding domain-containing protein [Planctomycetota bacterium]
MNPFAIATPDSHAAAQKMLVGRSYKLPVLKGAGIDLVDHLKEGLAEPDLLIDVRRVRDASRKDAVSAEGSGLRIEANATLAELVDSSLVKERCPVVGQAVANAATPSVRNVATAAGNLLQRPRCWYYRNSQFDCLKKGGATCFSVEGENKYHAIFGQGPCHIVHPSNLAPALMVANATVHLIGGNRKSLPIADLFHMPDKGVTSEHSLEPGEVITHITLDAAAKSGFASVKEKQSFDWPLAFACAALSLNGDTIKSATVCAGAVAPVPWMLPEVGAALSGVKITDDTAIQKAAAASITGAKAMTDNAYKLKLLPVVVMRAVLKAAGRDPGGL